MQDKNIYRELSDKGWSKMHDILDKEMPQKKKKRPIIWLFFLGALLFLTPFIYFLSDSDNALNDIVQEKNEIKTNNSINDNNINRLENNSLVNDNANKIENNNDENIEAKDVNVVNNNINYYNNSSNNVVANILSSNNNNLDDETLMMNNNISEISKPFNPININNSTTPTHKIDKQETKENKETEQVNVLDEQVFNELNTISSPLTINSIPYQPNYDIELEDDIQFISEKNKKHYLALSLSYLMQSEREYGIRTGLTYNNQMSRRWIFSTGLEYERRNAIIRPNSGETLALSFLDASEFFNEKEFHSQKYNSIQLPIRFQFLMTKKLSIEGGMSLAYYFPTEILSFAQDAAVENMGGTSTASPNFNEDIDSSTKDRLFSINPSITLHYHINKKLDVFASYDYSTLRRMTLRVFDIQSISIINPYDIRFHSFGIGMKWNFK